MTTIATPGADSAATKDLLDRYARLVVRVGINLEPGREVAIRAMIEHAPLVRALVRAGYEAGARRVEVDYEDLEVLRSQIALAPEEAVGTAPRWMFERLDDVREQRRAQVFVIGFPPDMFGGLDPARVARSFPAPAALRGALRKLHDSKARAWTVIACATPSWAKQVYGEPEVERLWQALAHVCRLDEPDPVAAWQTHIENLGARAALLNERRFDAVRFRGPGTDLTLGLLPQSRWCSVASKTSRGRRYVPNLPTDEVYTSPDRRRADGVVRTTRPVALTNGTIGATSNSCFVTARSSRPPRPTAKPTSAPSSTPTRGRGTSARSRSSTTGRGSASSTRSFTTAFWTRTPLATSPTAPPSSAPSRIYRRVSRTTNYETSASTAPTSTRT